MLKFKKGDHVVFMVRLKDHTDNAVRVKEYFKVREVTADNYIVGPRNELYLESELEFRHVARPNSRYAKNL